MDWGFICMRCGTLVNYPSLWGSRAMRSWGEESLAWGGGGFYSPSPLACDACRSLPLPSHLSGATDMGVEVRMPLAQDEGQETFPLPVCHL